MKPRYKIINKVSQWNIIDEIIVSNFDALNKVIFYGWCGKSDKNSLSYAIGKWKIKNLKK